MSAVGRESVVLHPPRTAVTVSPVAATGADDADRRAARRLLREYVAWLSTRFDADGHTCALDGEGADPAAWYAAQGGAVLLARHDGVALGHVAVRPLGDQVVEIKRLFIRPSMRGRGAGRALVMAAIDWAIARDAERVVLETSPEEMEIAHRLYRDVGFVDMPAYSTRVTGVLGMSLDLRPR